MSDYRRAFQAGGNFFFTVVTHHRAPFFSKEANVEILRSSFKREMKRRPFTLEAMVVLPDHLHCLWLLPEGDADYSSRWREIKKSTTQQLSVNRNYRSEGDVWQRRYWEHKIRDAEDWRIHMDYIHYNPVKHGYVSEPGMWKYSSFLKWVKCGVYDVNWGRVEPDNIGELEFE